MTTPIPTRRSAGADLPAGYARRAAGVSHDGAAIYGARIVAAMEALAFAEPDLNALPDEAPLLEGAIALIAAGAIR